MHSRHVPIAWSHFRSTTLGKMQSNTPTVRGMLQQVKRLVVVETEEMYTAHKQKEEAHLVLRPPLVVNHQPASVIGSV